MPSALKVLTTEVDETYDGAVNLNEYPVPIADLLQSMMEMLRLRDQTELVEVLRCARPRFDLLEVETWDRERFYWGLQLEVPIPLYVEIEPRIKLVEESISATLAHFERAITGNETRYVSISPIIGAGLESHPGILPSQAEVAHLWLDGMFRLFLSHVSTQSDLAFCMKEDLALRGVSAFVAHADIEPTKEWEKEICRALASMSAIAALVTTGFHASLWTDHEVGWALGRGVLVVPIRLGVDPYGLFGKVQAINGTNKPPEVLADSIVRVLLDSEHTHVEMRRSLKRAFVQAASLAQARLLSKRITQITDFTDKDKLELRAACTENAYVSSDQQVVQRIYDAFPETPEPVEEAGDDIPF